MLVAGAALRVPLIAVVLRRGYGLGAQAMVGGSLHEPLLTIAWPTAHLGPMGLEGAVRLALRKELEAIDDEDEREQRVRDLTAAAEENAKALNAAALFELDDVVDPAETRGLIASTLRAAAPSLRRPRRALRRPGRRGGSALALDQRPCSSAVPPSRAASETGFRAVQGRARVPAWRAAKATREEQSWRRESKT